MYLAIRGKPTTSSRARLLGAGLQATTTGLTFHGVNLGSPFLALLSVVCLSSETNIFYSYGSSGIYDDADAQALTGWLGTGEGRGEEFLAAA